MNLYWFLLPFAIVSVLAVDKENDTNLADKIKGEHYDLTQKYRNLVFFANKYIENTTQRTLRVDQNWNTRKYTGIEFTLKRMLLKNNYSMEDLTFTWTTPELAPYSHYPTRCIQFQTNLLTEVYQAMSLCEPPPETIADYGITFDQLYQVGLERRKMIRPALESLIKNINDENEEDLGNVLICQLIGLYKNSEENKLNGLKIIRTAIIDEVDRCCLISTDEETTYYKIIPPPTEHIIVEVFPDHTKPKPLLPINLPVVEDLSGDAEAESLLPVVEDLSGDAEAESLVPDVEDLSGDAEAESLLSINLPDVEDLSGDAEAESLLSSTSPLSENNNIVINLSDSDEN